MARSLTLFIPGLAGPPLPLSADELPPLPALSFILGRSRRRREGERSYYRILCELMGLDVPPDRDVPVAAVTRLIDGDEHPEGVWMRADPVHLSADRNRLMLLESSVFNVTQHDALAVATEVQKVLDAGDQGEAWRLEVPFRDRWYIKLPERPAVTTTDIDRVAGRDIDPLLPAGKEGTAWHRLMNEMQMQLHECDINGERAARGELPINSLWFWGIGELPEPLERRWSALYSDDAFLRGLAMLSMTPYHDAAGGPAEVLDEAGASVRLLVHRDDCRRAARYGDTGLWLESLQALERDWFEPALVALRDRRLQSLTIRTDGWRFTLTGAGLKKFWRRPKAVTRFNSEASMQ